MEGGYAVFLIRDYKNYKVKNSVAGQQRQFEIQFYDLCSVRRIWASCLFPAFPCTRCWTQTLAESWKVQRSKEPSEHHGKVLILNSCYIQSDTWTFKGIHVDWWVPCLYSKKVQRRVLKKNPLKNLRIMLKLNPYAKTMRRNTILRQARNVSHNLLCQVLSILF